MVFPDTTVELLLGGVWVDVTSDVLERDPIQIARGRSDNGSHVEASRCSLTFRNKSGDYSPRNPLGAHYRTRASLYVQEPAVILSYSDD